MSLVQSVIKVLVFTLLLLKTFFVDAETVYTNSPQDIFELFERIGYTDETWMNGTREVPRVFLQHIPERWKKNSQLIPVSEKKALFLRLTVPAVLHANSLIKEERRQLITVNEHWENPGISEQQEAWLLQLAKKYKVSTEKGITGAVIDELLLRVDELPVSLAVAQAAEESGWGTSRFAVMGNALFGQWDFSGKGIKPEQQREEKGNYGIARFDSPQDSVNAYMLNLNTHRSYTSLREHRDRLKKSGKRVTGYELARKLEKYSERGTAYVDSLHTIMRVNNLAHVDKAYLWDRETIYIVPAE